MTEIDFRTVFRLDHETGKLFWTNPPKNHAEKAGQEAGYINIGKNGNLSYWQVRAFGRTFKRSRVVFHMVHGRWPTPAVDHANRDSLDDRPSNLRECTPSQNTANRRPWAKDHPPGVSLTKQGRYMARITKDGRTGSLGTFDDPETAHAVYERARKEVFGEFA